MKRVVLAAIAIAALGCQRSTHATFARRAAVKFDSRWTETVPGNRVVLTYSTRWHGPFPEFGGGWGAIVEVNPAVMRTRSAERFHEKKRITFKPYNR